MTWLIDTNVISEVRKGRRGDPAVQAWWRQVREDDLFLSALTLGEIRKGVESLRPRDSTRAAALALWLHEVTSAFGPRILGIDGLVADAWGRMAALRPVPVVDALLAATAKVHGLTLVTRNVADIDGLGAMIVNPFTWRG
ncbi:MAG: type II toxin-antitoxin system VapC family toxin [Acetobacteraceae bacterium]